MKHQQSERVSWLERPHRVNESYYQYLLARVQSACAKGFDVVDDWESIKHLVHRYPSIRKPLAWIARRFT